MNNIQYFLANYVDDFMSIELREVSWKSYITLGNLLQDLGVQEADEKAVSPTHIIEFLGVWFNLLMMTISVTPE